MSDVHPLASFIAYEGAAKALGMRVGCSPSHLRNIRDGRKSASLGLAKELSDATGLPMRAFLREAVNGED